jgi:hypothetical protein
MESIVMSLSEKDAEIVDMITGPISFDHYDAIVIPGAGGPRDGLRPAETLPEWVAMKLDCFYDRWSVERPKTPTVVISAGTYHKAGALDANGRNSQESTSMTLYLEKRGFDLAQLYEENSSYDTVGNAFFLRAIHTDVRRWRRLLVIVNEFHLERLKLIFDWVFSLAPIQDYEISYAYLPDEKLGDNPAIRARIDRERQSFEAMRDRIDRLKLTTLSELHHWLHREHDLYSATNRKNLVLKKKPVLVSDDCLRSY